MKKLTVIAILMAMCLSLGSCSGNDSDGGNKVSSENGVTENISEAENVFMYLDGDGNYGFDKYDTDGRLVHTAVFDSEAESTYTGKSEYDEKDRLIRKVDGSAVFEYVYDEKDNLVKSTEDGVKTEYEYDDKGNAVKEIIKSSTMTETKDNIFDSNGNKTMSAWESNRGASKTTIVGETLYTYDDKGNLVGEKSSSVLNNPADTVELSEEYKYTYDEHGSLTLKSGFYEEWDAYYTKIIKTDVYEKYEYEYYDSGKVKVKSEFAEENFLMSETEYDEDGNVIRNISMRKAIFSGTTYSETTYDKNGKVTSSVMYDEKGNMVGYDGKSITKTESSDGKTIITFSDGNVSTYDADGHELQRDHFKSNGDLEKRYVYEYKDSLLVKHTAYGDKDNITNLIECDPEALTVKYIKYNNDGSEDRVSVYKYNSDIQMIEQTVHQNGEFRYRYTYAYDENGRRTERISYDADGNVIE